MILDALFGGGRYRWPEAANVPDYLKAFELETEQIADRPKTPVAGRLLSWQTKVPHYPPGNFRSFVTKGFRFNPIVRSCQDILARNFCQAALQIQNADTGRDLFEDLANPLGDSAARLLGIFRRGGRYRPTPTWTEKRLWTTWIQDLYTYGNTMWEKVRGVRTGEVVELWRLHPQHVAVEISPNRGVTRYLYDVGGQWWPIRLEDIVHGLFVDPDQDWFGLPPMFSSRRDLATDNQLVDHLKITLENLAIPPVVLEHDAILTPEAASDAKKAWKRKFGGMRRGDPAVLGKGTKVNVIGMDMEKMAIGELVATSEARVAMVHGVPMILLGRSGTQADPTRANYKEARLHLWEDTITPLLDFAASLLDVFLLDEFDPTGGMMVGWDTRSVRVLQEARLERGEKAAKIFETGMISRSSGQRMAGLPVHGPDVFYRPGDVGDVVPVDATTETQEIVEV